MGGEEVGKGWVNRRWGKGGWRGGGEGMGEQEVGKGWG